jgi:hypothetical protein
VFLFLVVGSDVETAPAEGSRRVFIASQLPSSLAAFGLGEKGGNNPDLTEEPHEGEAKQ